MVFPTDILQDTVKVISHSQELFNEALKTSQQEKMQNFMLSGWWQLICAAAGMIGVYLQILKRAMISVGDTREALSIYHKEHYNTILISIFTYFIIVGIWYTQGFEIAGMQQFQLSLMTIFIGYSSQDFFDGYAAKFNQNKKDGG